ncbi:MAG: hypothetical protein IJL49_02080 [Firmicutes bacterium]|nr:hypothetical protein [Bacillota bacterium]
MKKGLKKALVMLVSVAMVFTMMAMPVYADDTAVIQDEETVVLAEVSESYEAAETVTETATETAVEEPVIEETPAPEQVPETPAEEAVNVPAAEEGVEVPAENAETQEETIPAEPAGTETIVEEPVEMVDAGSEKAVDNLTAAITKLAADNMLKTEDEPAEEPVEELAYNGDVVKICENGVETEYRMLARQEGSTEAIKDGKVVIHLVPKNATVYTNLHYGSLKDTEMTKDVTINGEAFDITLPLDKCGKGIPVVPVKDSGETGSKQCYLCIPPQDKIPVAEEETAEKTDLTITNVQPMFKAVSAYLTKEGGQEYLVMAMSAKGYHEMYKGTKEQAIANGDGTKDKGNDTWIHGYTNSDGKWEFKIPLKSGESYVALVSVSNDKYNDYKNGTGKFEDCLYARQLKIDRTAKTLVTDNYKQSDDPSAQNPDDPDPEKPDPVKPDDPSKPDESGSGDSGYAPAVDTSTTLADGEYTPDSFSWSGGTGKLTISCTKITVKNGQAYATIVFSSEKVDQLKASGSLYYKEGGGPSTFTIPVNLNANNTVIARTTAMSQPHWVEYTLYIGLAENEEQAEKAKQAKKDAAEARMKISEEAPAIVGLEAKDTESTVEYSKYFKIFEYEHGVKMLSIDISEKTALDEEYSENAKKALAAGNSEEQVQYDDNGKAISKSKEEYITELYKNKVVNYLLVPEDFEVPAGLDKEYIIVTVPSEKTLMASDEVIAMMEELGCLDAISLLAMDEKDVKNDTLKKALKDEKIKLAGTLEKPEYAKVVKDKSDLAVLPGDVLPEEIDKNAKDKEKLEKEAKEKQEALEEMESRFAALEVPVIIDRSAAEEEELAQAEWIKVYGALFGCEEEADKIFEKKVKEAEKNGKN